MLKIIISTPKVQNDVIPRQNYSLRPRFTIFFLLFSKPKCWIEVRDRRPKYFTFFAAKTLNSGMQPATDTFYFFRRRHTSFSRAISDQKFYFISARSHRNSVFSRRKFLLFLRYRVTGFLTEAVFTFFKVKKRLKIDFSIPKIQIFPTQNIPKKWPEIQETCVFASPRDPQNRVFARDFPF